MVDIYKRVKRAKSYIRGIETGAGWPDTKDGIEKLVQGFGEFKQAVIYTGRFVHKFDGWHFMFPPTARVVEVMEGLLPLNEDILFIEDEEG